MFWRTQQSLCLKSEALILPSSTDQHYQRKPLLRLHGLSQIQHLEHVSRHLPAKKVPLLPLGCRYLHGLLGHLMCFRCNLPVYPDCLWLGPVYRWRYMRQLWRSCSCCRHMQHRYGFHRSRYANPSCSQTQSLHAEEANGHIYICNGWQVSLANFMNIPHQYKKTKHVNIFFTSACLVSIARLAFALAVGSTADGSCKSKLLL